MDQERIGALIKDIRKKNNLSQSAFAKKYGVTYQAVSKWETGKNIPDLAIIKQICSDYDISLEELLDGTTKETRKNKVLVAVILFIIGIITIALGLLFLMSQQPKDNFEFKTLSSQTELFKLTGSIAYNNDKTSIFISDIEYKGDDNNEYKEIKGTLYEIDGNKKQSIGTYNKSLLITFNEYINGMSFNVDNHASICKEYTEESLLIEIEATNKQDKTTKYEIPIKISENCNHKD
jgi:transcriptional regulator with XRE-family HTH domain